MLDRLFDADRASVITEVVLGAVREFDIDLTQMHNDSTTVTFSGGYHQATGTVRGGKATAVITASRQSAVTPLSWEDSSRSSVNRSNNCCAC